MRLRAIRTAIGRVVTLAGARQACLYKPAHGKVVRQVIVAK